VLESDSPYAYSAQALAKQGKISNGTIEIIYNSGSRLAQAGNLKPGQVLPVMKVY